MAFSPRVDEEAALAVTYEQTGSRMTSRDRVAEAVVAVGFAAATAALFLVSPPHGFRIAPAIVSLVLMAFATRVQFDTPFGFTVATQLAFVPMIFALPVALVPIAVVLAFALSSLVGIVRGRTHPSRLLLAVGNSWFAIGPAAVFAIAGVAPARAGAALLVDALLAQFAVDFAISTLRLWIAREIDLVSQLGDTWIYAVDAALSGVGLAVAQDMQSRSEIELVVAPMLALLAVFAHERRGRLQHILELGNAYRGTALVLGDVVEADDAYTGAHCKGIVAQTLAVAEILGLTSAQRRNLEFGALLHDVGKIAMPKSIINKPGKLTAEEWTVIKTHTLEGQKMLDRVGGFMHEVGLIVRSHHERWDGEGYPDGLAGEAIPIEARIISCCDAWNAMRTDRSYRKALSAEVALAELEANAGRQFDPAVVSAVIQVVGPELALERESASRLAKQPARLVASANPVVS